MAKLYSFMHQISDSSMQEMALSALGIVYIYGNLNSYNSGQPKPKKRGQRRKFDEENSTKGNPAE